MPTASYYPDLNTLSLTDLKSRLQSARLVDFPGVN